MKAYTYLLAFWLLAVPWTLRAEELPIFFARSGQRVTFPVTGDDGKTERTAALWALGRQWIAPVLVRSGVAEFTAPKVRVPVAFRLTSLQDAEMAFGELVVYPDPDRPVSWDKDMQLMAVAIPDWFDTWTEAVGLPVQKFKGINSLADGNWRMLEKPGLLILGRKAVQGGLAAVGRLAAEYEINVLVLGSDWVDRNETVRHEVALLPKDMTGPLADLQTQDWALPPTFRQRTLCVANRQTWIAGATYPLVEEIRIPEKGQEHLRVVWSYVPWPQQLGRNEVADALFVRLLTETAKGADGRPPLDGRWRLLYPAAKDIKADERPVLAAALKSAELDVGNGAEAGEIRAYVLDLRGKTSPEALSETFGGIKTIEARIGTESPLLVLGDSPILDTWEWLELDRVHHRSPRPGVVWWPDGSLPASIESQLRLMQLFTEWNISLGNISQEAGNEDRKNGP